MPPAIGFLLVLAGIFFIRQTVVGRAAETPGDARDLVTSIFSGDYKSAKEVAAKRGSAVSDTTGTVSPDSADPGSVANGSANGAALLAECERLGGSAKGYRYAGTGPDYYDCSGLVWRAMRNLGIYTGPRFSTATWVFIGPGIADQVMVPAVGDIVVWPGEHMGVYTGNGNLYSALNKNAGIKNNPISKTRSGTPQYWRLH